jgi:phosphatidylglycerol phospholipase C
MRDCKKQNRALFLWTVNEEGWMKWSIKKEVDGVITDDPKKFLDVCKDYDESTPIHRLALREYPSILWLNILVIVFSLLFRFRYGFTVDIMKLRKERQTSRPPLKLA